VTDELVDRFLRAVFDLGKTNQRGWAAGEDVMQRMDWDPSDLRLGNPDRARWRVETAGVIGL
jgi:hypothetical protein